MSKVLGIFIGSGGTGAKVAEAMVHATAAGLGPDKLLVGLVDQDGGNGNTSSAVQAVQAYANARRALRSAEGAHRLGNDGDLLLPEISLISEADPIWIPHPDGNTTLDRAVGRRSDGDAALFDALFEQGVTEQEMPFEIGYRARPNVGALAMALAMQDRSQAFVKGVRDAIQQAAQGWTVRLIVAGSIFGGTGAAGLPTLSRLLREAVPKQFTRDFRMGGILMLPYFSFDDPSDAQAATFANASQFLPSSRAALTYYHALRAREQLPFDHACLVGWDPLFVAGSFNPGGGNQDNPPMPPELLAALGACDFCRSDGLGEASVTMASRAAPHKLDWMDLPSPDADPLSPYHGFGHLLRFAVAWQHWNDEAGAQANRGFTLRRRPMFYSKQGLDKINWKGQPPQAERDALDRWTADVLEWARSVAGSASTNKLDFQLWKAPPQPDALAGSGAYAEAYDGLLHTPKAVDAPATADKLFTLLSDEAGPASATGLGRLAAQLFRGTATK